MSKDKREIEYPAELESQFILRLPEEPAKQLRELLKSGENTRNRLSIKMENDMRHGEVCFDNWLMHSKVVDLPTIIESLKTIDNKSFYKTADVCQMMICKTEPEQPPVEDESPAKNKKKDPYKVDKKFLWPHGVTPPTKNVRKRRFRKTLRKKFVEAPEIEKEVKRLLRADIEAESFDFEIIKEEDQHLKPASESTKTVHTKHDKKSKAVSTPKPVSTTENPAPGPSNVVDIFGGAVSDSDLEDDNVNVENQLSAKSKMRGDMHTITSSVTKMFQSPPAKSSASHSRSLTPYSPKGDLSADDLGDEQSREKENMTQRIEELKAEVETLKQRRVRTKNEIQEIENIALRQRFQQILHTLNQDIMYKEMEYQGLLTLQNSEDI